VGTGASGPTKRGPKKQKCDSYVVFEVNLNRSRAFIRVFGEEDRKPGGPTNDERELLRGSVVFAIGALDNFVHELILELVPQFGGSNDALRGPLQNITKADPALALRVALAPTPARAQEEFRVALDGWLESQTFHGVKRILDGAAFVGVKVDESTLTTDWRTRLEHYTKMRHEIVHRGKRPGVKRDDADGCSTLVASIAAAINGEAVKLYH
jgi:hypothetical protein